MFELIYRAARLSRQFFQPDPDESGTADVVALEARVAALAAFQASDWFTFPVPRLHLPPVAARLLGRYRRVLSPIVGDDPFRTVGRHRYSEPGYRMVFGKALDLDPLALRQVHRLPHQRIHPLVGTLATGIIHLAVVLEGTVGVFWQRLDEQHPGVGSVPPVPPPSMEGSGFLIHDLGQPLLPVLTRAVAIASRILKPGINPPERSHRRVDLHASDHPDARDPGVGIPPVLPPPPFKHGRVVLVPDGVINDHLSLGRRHSVIPALVPDAPGGDPVVTPVPSDPSVTEGFGMVSSVRQGIVDRGTQPIVAVIQSSHRGFHGGYRLAAIRTLPFSLWERIEVRVYAVDETRGG